MISTVWISSWFSNDDIRHLNCRIIRRGLKSIVGFNREGNPSAYLLEIEDLQWTIPSRDSTRNIQVFLRTFCFMRALFTQKKRMRSFEKLYRFVFYWREYMRRVKSMVDWWIIRCFFNFIIVVSFPFYSNTLEKQKSENKNFFIHFSTFRMFSRASLIAV